MKKKAVLTILVMFVAAGALFATGGDEPAASDDVADGPQYGGTITYMYFPWQEPATADFIKALWPSQPFAFFAVEPLLYNDYETHGPRGTEDWATGQGFEIPMKWIRGGLAESWEIQPDKLVFKIREGVMWAADGKEHVMEPREVTPEDIAWNLERWLNESPGHGVPGSFWTENGGWVDDIVVDGDMVTIETSSYYLSWKEHLINGWTNGFIPPESVEAGLESWDNLVASGPWMVKEFVSGSAMIFEPNPSYWGTTTIDGVEYSIPFADELVVPIIPDAAAQLAALRTGKVDRGDVGILAHESLMESAPELQTVALANRPITTIYNVQNEILSNRDVRRALGMAVDIREIQNNVFGQVYGFLDFPYHEIVSNMYTPFEELPESLQEILTYDPDQATALLANAGYPDGFELTIVLDAGLQDRIDIAAMLKDFWEDVGVTLNLEVMDNAAWTARLWGSGNAGAREVKSELLYDVLVDDTVHIGNISPAQSLFTPSGFNFSNWYDDDYMARWNEAMETIDEERRNSMIKELSIEGWDEVAYLPIGSPLSYVYWWPWLQNYYGEGDDATFSHGGLTARMWVDEALKSSLGY